MKIPSYSDIPNMIMLTFSCVNVVFSRRALKLCLDALVFASLVKFRGV